MQLADHRLLPSNASRILRVWTAVLGGWRHAKAFRRIAALALHRERAGKSFRDSACFRKKVLVDAGFALATGVMIESGAARGTSEQNEYQFVILRPIQTAHRNCQLFALSDGVLLNLRHLLRFQNF